MHVVNLHQLYQPGFLAVVLHDEAAFALVVDVLVIEIGEFDKGLIGLFEPVAHDAGVVIQLMNEVQIFPLQRA